MTWNVPANARSGPDRVVQQARQAREQQVHLELRALGARLGIGSAQQPRQLGRRGVDEHVAGAQFALGGAVGVADVDAGGVGRDGEHLRVRR